MRAGGYLPRAPEIAFRGPFQKRKHLSAVSQPKHIFSPIRAFSGEICAKRTGRCIGTTPLRGLGITETGAFPNRHYVQVKDRLAWLAGEIRQSEIPRSDLITGIDGLECRTTGGWEMRDNGRKRRVAKQLISCDFPRLARRIHLKDRALPRVNLLKPTTSQLRSHPECANILTLVNE